MTWQIRDTIIFNGIKYDLNQNLLDNYFQEFKKNRPEINVIDTACWRGHTIHFIIQNDELKIKNINWLGENGKLIGQNLIKDYFPNRKFEWFSGFLRIDDFKGDYDNEKNENAIYEFLEINCGNLINHWKFDFSEFSEFKNILFEEFKKLEEYDSIFFDLKNSHSKEKHSFIENLILQEIISLTNENYLKLKKT